LIDSIPYYSLIQSFQHLTRQLLTEDEGNIHIWKEQLLTALGMNGQVIIDVIPELEILLGEQPDIPELGAVENQNRFNRVFQRFVAVFENQAHPLVIFLDDLQWADQATLDLIEVIMGDPDSQYVYLLGAYRDNEVNDSHPLMGMLDRHEKHKNVHRIFLSPLSETQARLLISDTLHQSSERVNALADLVYEKTQGNPFFVNMFLNTLYQENLITFNHDQHVWEWDLETIKGKEITNNVVELMIGRIKKLSGETQSALSLAAAIGNQFDLHTLSLVCASSPQDVYHILWQSLQQGLIVPIGKNYKYVEDGKIDEFQDLGVRIDDDIARTDVLMNDACMVDLPEGLTEGDSPVEGLLQGWGMGRCPLLKGDSFKILYNKHQRILILLELIGLDHTLQPEALENVEFLFIADQGFRGGQVFFEEFHDHGEAILRPHRTVDQ